MMPLGSWQCDQIEDNLEKSLKIDKRGSFLDWIDLNAIIVVYKYTMMKLKMLLGIQERLLKSQESNENSFSTCML